MKIGINLLLCTSHVDESFYPLLGDLKKMGFDGVEIPVLGGSSAEYKALGKELSNLGLGVTATTVMTPETNPISPDVKIRAAAVDRMRRILDYCSEINAEILGGPLHSALGLFSGAGPTPDEYRYGLDFFRKVSVDAEAAHVQLALEYLNRFENYFLTTAADTFRLVDEVDHPACGMMWDTFHGHIEEKSPEVLERIRSRLFHVHISENDRGVPGTGQVRWAENFRSLHRIKYDRWMVIEAFGRALPDLAAATRVWRDLFENSYQLCEEGKAFIEKEWKTAKES